MSCKPYSGPVAVLRVNRPHFMSLFIAQGGRIGEIKYWQGSTTAVTALSVVKNEIRQWLFVACAKVKAVGSDGSSEAMGSCRQNRDTIDLPTGYVLPKRAKRL